MFTRILVPMDRTVRADEALEAASRLARRTGAGLVLVHVEEPITDMARTVLAQQELARRIQELRDAGVERHLRGDLRQR